VTAHPTAAWVRQQLIEATSWGRRPKHLVRDRDAVYGGAFRERTKRRGIETVLTPVRAPRGNAIAERVSGTFRQECLDHLLIVDKAHPRTVLTEYAGYFNRERPHRSSDLQPPQSSRPALLLVAGPNRWKPVLGGLLHVYERAA
jgi:transposase InsO family protein